MRSLLLNQYSTLTLSFLALFLSLAFMIQKAYLEPLEKYQNTIEFLSEKYRQNEIVLSKKLYELTKDKENQEVVELAIIPKLLHKINDTAKKPKVIIRNLIPNIDNPFRFELQFIANYFDFIGVLSEFEKLDILIHHIDVKPYEINKNSPKHIITIDIQAIQGAEKLSEKVSLYLEKEINKTEKRNPFQRFAKLGGNIERIIDLTWIHKLTSIGKINGKYIATINRRQYFEGDIFEGMKIINIYADKVTFNKKTQNGTTKYIIKFRKFNPNKREDRNEIN